MSKIFTVTEYSLSKCEATGRRWTYQASNQVEALSKVLYFAKLANRNACVGVTSRVIYPCGKDGDLTWIVKKG